MFYCAKRAQNELDNGRRGEYSGRCFCPGGTLRGGKIKVFGRKKK